MQSYCLTYVRKDTKIWGERDRKRERARERESARERERERVKYTDNELFELLGALNLSPLKTNYNSLVEPVDSTKLFTHDSPITTHDLRLI